MQFELVRWYSREKQKSNLNVSLRAAQVSSRRLPGSYFPRDFCHTAADFTASESSDYNNPPTRFTLISILHGTHANYHVYSNKLHCIFSLRCPVSLDWPASFFESFSWTHPRLSSTQQIKYIQKLKVRVCCAHQTSSSRLRAQLCHGLLLWTELL